MDIPKHRDHNLPRELRQGSAAHHVLSITPPHLTSLSPFFSCFSSPLIEPGHLFQTAEAGSDVDVGAQEAHFALIEMFKHPLPIFKDGPGLYESLSSRPQLMTAILGLLAANP